MVVKALTEDLEDIASDTFMKKIITYILVWWLNYIEINQRELNNNVTQNQKKIIFQNEIKFQNVYFAYKGAKIDQINNMCFSIYRGNNIANKDKTGTWKSKVGTVMVELLRLTKVKI